MIFSRSTETKADSAGLRYSICGLVVITGGMASLATDSALWLVLVILACAVHSIFTSHGREPVVSEGLIDGLCALAFFVGLLEYWLFRLSITMCMAHFLTVVAVLVLFRKKQESHYRLMRLTLIGVTATAALTTDAWIFLLSFIAVACVLIWNHMAHDISSSHGSQEREGQALSLVAGSVGVGLAVFFVAGVVYLGYPRVSARKFGEVGPSSQSEEEKQTSIGFTESVSPGEIDTRVGGNEEVMKVTFALPDSKRNHVKRPILMRGQVMGSYSDGNWDKYHSQLDRNVSFRRSLNLDTIPLLSRETYLLKNVPSKPPRVLQRIHVKESDTRVLFCLARPVWATGDGSISIGFDPVTHILYTLYPPVERQTYRVVSRRPHIPQSRLQDARTMSPQTVEGPFLETPADLEPHLEDTLEQIRQIYDPQTNYDHVTAVKRYLRSSGQFDYTLAGPEMAGMDPIKAFLSRTRSGSCTHFASSMVFLLRAQDIPARLVVGFRGGEKGEEALTRTFYQRHAHAWVEVAFENYGWLAFDPTPAGLGGEASFDSIFAQLKDLLTGPRGTWFYVFVGYSKYHQEQFLDVLGDILSLTLQQTDDLFLALGQLRYLHAGWAVLVGGLVLAGLAVAWLIRHFDWYRRGSRQVPIEFYRRVISILREKGLQRPRHLTAREFAGQAARQLREGDTNTERVEEALERLTELYYGVRYGGRELTAREEREVHGLLEALRETTPPRPGCPG